MPLITPTLMLTRMPPAVRQAPSLAQVNGAALLTVRLGTPWLWLRPP